MKKTPKIDASAFFLIVIVLVLAAGAAAAFIVLHSNPVEDSLAGDRVINTLFVIEEGGKPLCSYVLMYYPATRRAAVFDIPGSIGLILKNIQKMDRIDTVYDPRRIAPFEREVEGLIGVEISNTAVIDLDRLGKITDLIEGVEIFIPSGVNIYQEEPILIPSGKTKLDGDKAKTYITYELPEENSEFAGFRRQRFFLGFLKRIGEQSEIFKNPQTGRLCYSFIKTGLNQKDLFRLFDEFAKIDTDRVNIQSVRGNIRETGDGQRLIFPLMDGSLIKDIVRETLRGLVRSAEGSLSERIFTVEILNGTEVSGLAGRTAELIRGFGYDVITIGNADSSDHEATYIVDHTGFENVVQDFANIIRCTDIRYEAPGSAASELDMEIQNFEYEADFTLIIGRDFNERYVTGN